MGGKSKKVTTGYRYHVAFHHGLAATPIDALLEIRCADKTAWTGEQTANGVISINQPNLFGGDKDQGGIVGDLDLMLGKPGQQPNGYLAATFGAQQPAWLGVTTLVWKGGQWGSNNPYPQAPSYKIRSIKMGWDGDPGDGSACWYPTKAAVPVASATTLPIDATGWEYQILADEADPGNTNLAIPASGWTVGAQAPFGTGTAQIPWHTEWPMHTILWARRSVTIAGANQVLTVNAENGCVVFLDGAIVGAVNRSNSNIPANETHPVVLPLNVGQTYELTVKAFDEPPQYNGGATSLAITVQAPGLTGMNPAHILYDLLTSQDRGAEPVASINDASFRAGADWFYAQGIGLCTNYDPDAETVGQAIQRIEKVAGCSVSRSPVDGLWYLDIANGVYDLASLPTLTDDDILAFSEAPSTLDDVVNSVSVEYVDVAQHLTLTTPPVQCLALINSAGLNSQTNQYHEAPTASLATRFAQRDLQNGITPKHSFDLTTTRKPYAWRVNTYFRLQSARRGIADMVCLLAEKSSGTLKSGAIKITATEDVYSLPATSFVTSEPGVDSRPPGTPVAAATARAFEAPWTTVSASLSAADLAALPADAAYVLAAAVAPGDYPDYNLLVSSDGGSTFADAGVSQWAPSALIVEGETLSGAVPTTNFTLSGGTVLGQVALGSAALWDDEVVRVDALDATAYPPTLTLGRGCADTVPAVHAAGSRIWFYDDHAAADTTQYAAGETVQAKILTNIASAQLDPSLATALSVTLAGRAALPYPPAKVRIGGNPYPATGAGSLVLTWARRDRDAQADQLVDSEAADVQPADDVRYSLSVLDASNAVLIAKDDIDGTTATVALAYTGDVTLVLGAINNAGASLQQVRIPLAYTRATGATENTITASTWEPSSVIFVAGGA